MEFHSILPSPPSLAIIQSHSIVVGTRVTLLLKKGSISFSSLSDYFVHCIAQRKHLYCVCGVGMREQTSAVINDGQHPPSSQSSEPPTALQWELLHPYSLNLKRMQSLAPLGRTGIFMATFDKLH